MWVVVNNKAQVARRANRHKSILLIYLVATLRRDDLMRTETYLISALILNYWTGRSERPGVRQPSTVIKFYFTRPIGRARIYEILTFINSQRLALTANPRDGIIARCSL